ncbi:sulfite exporter TauE/SafE family protein [Ferrimonas sp. SCSIO 43195]|uniref:urease accessory protein UreH domain-containing protein n=1 Tax=Ferrimonas sp. SCSIO 43195 TaxID=2822844 RepID=UPI0020763990|nr:sulfite exporter TauE/SafE family protein [Ferrimonas sp. SCSIO 43195]USD38116.1 sulfite exporter TauE/SafE family protein [Ferrimonas sp. SCSIO 43195]
MEFDTLFYVALQSSLVLGLVHGVNPCGHSWLVLAPFVAGSKDGKHVSNLTAAFIVGTTLGCLAIGLALGLLSSGLPEQVLHITDIVTAIIIIALGAILLWRPHLLHSHDHDHDHGHCHGHSHDHGHCHSHGKPKSLKKATAFGLASIGFVNMIVPCPTVAMMYSYSLTAANTANSVAVFFIYAVGTGISMAAVIFAIFRATSAMRKLQKPWIEPAIMRSVGVLTIGFGVYTLYSSYLF